jgi:hypothetical protein
MALAVPLLLGCSEILRAEFDTGPGVLASGPLPGPPSGDSAVVTGQVIGVGSGVSLVLGAGGPNPRLDLVTGGKPHDTSEYWVGFRGVKLTITQTPVLAIDTIDEDGRIACRLEISGGEFRLVSGAGSKVIGEYSSSADEHKVLMRIDKTAHRCFIQITQVAQGSGPGAEPTMPTITADGPFHAAAFGELDIVRFAWEQVAPGDATQYFLDDVVASKRD